MEPELRPMAPPAPSPVSLAPALSFEERGLEERGHGEVVVRGRCVGRMDHREASPAPGTGLRRLVGYPHQLQDGGCWRCREHGRHPGGRPGRPEVGKAGAWEHAG